MYVYDDTVAIDFIASLNCRSIARGAVVGEKVDPHRHESVGEAATAAAAELAGVVVEEVRSGFIASDGVVLRYATAAYLTL